MDYNLWYECPFFKYAQRRRISCEAGNLWLPENETRLYIDRYCANLKGYPKCTLAAQLLEYYDKKEKQENEKQRTESKGSEG